MIETTYDAHEHGNVLALDLRTTEEIAEEEAQSAAYYREEILGLPARPGVTR